MPSRLELERPKNHGPKSLLLCSQHLDHRRPVHPASLWNTSPVLASANISISKQNVSSIQGQDLDASIYSERTCNQQVIRDSKPTGNSVSQGFAISVGLG
jgi:hypothetical protein